ncbi:ABC transporter ATP-binding protein [Brevundimonas staleyi]|uniref:ABC transporter ATP-binding protein n=1 Tax=Brevundimonas staleyi TaxID=74326 RepID=A0ABW0FXF8_9CAUL
MTDLVLEGVTRRYGAKAAVEGVGFTLRPGRITALLGPSGSGKTTLMRLIAGLEAVGAGTIRLGDEILSSADLHTPPETRGVGLVFQDYALFPHLSVLDNVAFGLGGMARKARDAKALALLDQVGLADRARNWPHDLSGGEQQRVALMRAMAREPKVLLLDEPFSGLDRHLKGAVRDFLFPALRVSGAAVAIVTHDVDEALLLADDLVLLHQGRVLQSGTPVDCYREPVSPEAARLLGEVTVLSGRVEEGVATTAFGILPATDQVDGEVEIVVRPESVRLDRAGVLAKVVGVRFAGQGFDYRLEREGRTLSLRAEEGRADVGDTVTVSLDPAAVRLFPKSR